MKAFRGLVVSGGWDGRISIADGDDVVALQHPTRAWCYSVAPFVDASGALSVVSGHTGGMTGDGEVNLRLWRVQGKASKRKWVETAPLRGHGRGVMDQRGELELASSTSH